jgi:hypothetical protein
MVELGVRVEELEGLKGQVIAVEMSIAKAVSGRTLIITHDTNPFPSGKVY